MKLTNRRGQSNNNVILLETTFSSAILQEKVVRCVISRETP